MPANYSDEYPDLPQIYSPGKIGVVTVLYNSSSVLDDFFASIERQTYTKYSVYCVDNASGDDSVQRSANRPYTTVIENGQNLGVATGNNMGTRAALAEGCEFVLYLNNDVVFGPRLFADLVEGLAIYNCSMTTPIMFYHNRPEIIWAAGGRFQPWLGYRCQHLRQGEYAVEFSRRGEQVSYTPSCCVLVRRELFVEIGLMDERYFVYYDDTDFMLRAYKRGLRLILLPYSHLWHKVSSLAGADSAFTVRYLTRNQALYHHKNVTPIGAWLVSMLYCLYFVTMWLARRMDRKDAFGRIRLWSDGIYLAYQVQG